MLLCLLDSRGPKKGGPTPPAMMRPMPPDMKLLDELKEIERLERIKKIFLEDDELINILMNFMVNKR